ncbi:dc7e27fd-cc52-4829-af5b-f21791d23f40 [Sclerotinia trifoliorum]|uniref:Dc7e27fd-cc52-4829-af5b-f21791d23f40 n=1 Tax=Sclerotinia trifoliorum TaxID=28548 RepID=A0A8H2W2K7_9HELO|nr:dc7e27fd-cc52-4829-af5b-f21791d23f40 [Sclerotinia trifoliorum]
MTESEAWRFEFHGENENKKKDRTRSVSPCSQEPVASQSPTIEDQSQSDSTEKEPSHQCRDTLLSKNCLMRLQNGFLYHKDMTIITDATKRQMEHNQTPMVEVVLSESPQRPSNVPYVHWEDEAAVDRCIEEYHVFLHVHSCFLILSRAPNNRQFWEVKK